MDIMCGVWVGCVMEGGNSDFMDQIMCSFLGVWGGDGPVSANLQSDNNLTNL